MKRIPFLALMALATAGALPALASEQRPAEPRAGWLSTEQLSERLTAQGYTVQRLEAERRGYEARLTNAQGQEIKAHVDPVSGQILRSHARGDRHHDGRHDERGHDGAHDRSQDRPGRN